MADDDYSYTVKLKRGGGDDVQKCTVTARSIDALREKVDNVTDLMKQQADEYRAIDPDARRALDDDQSKLSGVQA